MQILDDSKSPETEKLDEESRKNENTAKFRKHTLNLADYKNFCDYIERFIEVFEINYAVNTDLIERENKKRSGRKGNWRSTKELKEVTRLMGRFLYFTKNVRL